MRKHVLTTTIATLAVWAAIAIAGGATAVATLIITGANIRDHTITYRDMARGSVRSAAIKDSTITWGDLGAGVHDIIYYGQEIPSAGVISYTAATTSLSVIDASSYSYCTAETPDMTSARTGVGVYAITLPDFSTYCSNYSPIVTVQSAATHLTATTEMSGNTLTIRTFATDGTPTDLPDNGRLVFVFV